MGLMLIFFLFLFNLALQTLEENVERNVKVWGPGLKPHRIIMPARYFFINVPKNIHIKDVQSHLQVKINGVTNYSKNCHIWINMLNSTDGLYIVRYKIYETCNSLNISILYKNINVLGSPFVFNEPIYSDDCVCPVEDVKKFLSLWECGDIPKQINEDLQFFDKIDWELLRSKVVQKFNAPNAVSLCNYVIKHKKIYRKCYGKYVGFKMFMDNILLSLSRKVNLPDLEFFVNLGDWPLVTDITDKLPIFSWCGSTSSFDIVLPTYDLLESTIENMGRVTLDMLSVQGNAKLEWEEKISKLFWRGRDSNVNRLKLINISRTYPDLFNVSLTNFFFFQNEENLYGPKAKHVSFFDFFDYKYQLNIDGTVAAYRFPYLLAGGSLALKQDSKYYEHFYGELIPNIHYIPVKTDLSDLVEKIKWARGHDENAKQISVNAKIFANKHLLPKNIFCYYAMSLLHYKMKLVSEVNVLEGMEEVTQLPKSNRCYCQENVKDEL